MYVFILAVVKLDGPSPKLSLHGSQRAMFAPPHMLLHRITGDMDHFDFEHASIVITPIIHLYILFVFTQME